MIFHDDCRLFTGYKPCQHKRSCEDCPHYDPVGKRIVIVSLEALGAVLRSTCLLPAIKRVHPDSHITWVTLKSALPLLDQNPMIDRVITVEPKTAAVLQHLEFDVLYAVDKSMEAGALAETITAKQKFGFGLDRSGVIKPLSKEAGYQYQVGLDDQLKFFENQKPETQQITETMGLVWQKDPYVLEFTAAENKIIAEQRQELTLNGKAKGVIGYNTGCSLLFPYKKFTVERSVELISNWRKAYPEHTIALLGGPEDNERQEEMKNAFIDDPWVINTPTKGGLRSGIRWMAGADMVLSGCSLGLHIAIALKKPVIAWFGVSCIQEIDVYNRGVKIQSKVSCSPCWKKSCENEPKCFDMVPIEAILEATSKLLER